MKAECVPFVKKLERLLSDTTQDSITWSKTGESILINNHSAEFSSLLPVFFRHNQISSFIRQLNKHGFKVTKHQRNISEYSHPHFRRDSPHLWSRIRWNTPKSSPKCGSGSYSNPSSPNSEGTAEFKKPAVRFPVCLSPHEQYSPTALNGNSALDKALDNAMPPPSYSVSDILMQGENDRNDVSKAVLSSERRLAHMENMLTGFRMQISKQSSVLFELEKIINEQPENVLNRCSSGVDTGTNFLSGSGLSIANSNAVDGSSSNSLRNSADVNSVAQDQTMFFDQSNSSDRIKMLSMNTSPGYGDVDRNYNDGFVDMPSLMQGSLSPNSLNNNNSDAGVDPNPKVLLLTSSGFNNFMLVELLQRLNIVYTATFNVNALVETLRNSSDFDILIFDSNLIGSDGLIASSKSIKPNLPIICLCDLAESANRVDLAGDYVLINPPSMQSLTQIIKKVYSRE